MGFRKTTQSKKPDKALRDLDIISPKPSVTSNLRNHLRLIQDFLQTSCDDFGLLSSREGVSSVLGEILESSFVKKESLYPVNDGDLQRDASRFVPSYLSVALSSCGSAWNLHRGQYHCLAISNGFAVDVYVGSSLISLYGKCGELENAYKVFEEMPVKNVLSWTAIIAGFAQEWQVDECLELYSMMRNSMSKPNDLALTCILNACTGSGALGQGRSAHCQTIEMGFGS